MAVEMTALALMVGDSMSSVEFKAAGDLHGIGAMLERQNYRRPLAFALAVTGSPSLLSIDDHRRDVLGMTYVYPVVSRRAGGVSVGINLNSNNACNWHCIYCQVPNLTRGGPPPIDLTVLAAELRSLLRAITSGSFFLERVANPAHRRLMDVAFSGNGEPTSAPEFAAAVALVREVMAEEDCSGVKLRLITNGSLLDRASTQEGVALIAEAGGEVWFKVDGATAVSLLRVNGTRTTPAAVLRRLRQCAALCPTWVQTCVFARSGVPPAAHELEAYVSLVGEVRQVIEGIHLYGLARPSLQSGSEQLTRLPLEWLEGWARKLRRLGFTVNVSP
jgi:wyosine [tRNA(Phe)-imidazoG37] synthetase (radical SAM superfamily)